MAEQCISLKISGPLLSKLFHESYCNEGYCGGMLFGEIISITKNEITDSDHRISEHSTICVQDYRPMPRKRSFFINRSDENNTSNSVGFYRIRASTNRLSLLEKSMHKALLRDNPHHKNKIVTLLITYEHTDMSCLSWKLRAYLWKSDGEFSVVKVNVNNLQGSVLSSYVTNPNPISGILSSDTRTTLKTFESSISEKTGKIKLVESTREVTNNLIMELEQTVDEFDRHQMTLENCYKEKLLLSQQLQLLTNKVNELEYQKSHPRPSPQLYDGKLHNRQNDVKSSVTQNTPSHFEDDYEKLQRQSLKDMKLKSPVVVLKKIDLTSDLPKASPFRESKHNVQGEPASSSVDGGQNDVNVTDDLIRFNDIA